MVYTVKRSLSTKIAYFTFVLLLAFMLVIGLPSMEAKAFVPLVIAGVAIAPEVVAAGATLLCAAGITFASSADAQRAFTDMWVTGSTNLRSNLSALGAGIVSVSDSLWTTTRDWVNSRFKQGTNTITSQYHESNVNGNTIPYSTSTSTVFTLGSTYSLPETYNLYVWSDGGWNHVDYPSGTTIQILPYYYTTSGGVEYYKMKTLINGIDTDIAYSDMSTGKYLGANSPIDFYIVRDISIQRYQLWISAYNQNGVKVNYKVTDLKAATDAMTSPTVSAQGESVVGQSDYDFKTDAGTRTIQVPSTVDEVVGKTYTQVQNPTATPEPVTPYSNSWVGSFRACVPTGEYTFAGSGTYTGTMGVTTTGTWEGEWTWAPTDVRKWTGTFTDSTGATWTGTATETAVIPGGNDGVLGNIWNWLQEFWEKILEKMQQALQPVAQTLEDIKSQVEAKTKELVDSIATVTDTVNTNTAEPDLEQPTRNFRLPDFVFGLFAVVKACIRLVLRACVFLATIVAIQPDSSLLNSNAIAGIDFFKNQNIPVLNITVWNMFSGMMTLVISLSVVRKVRSNFTG